MSRSDVIDFEPIARGYYLEGLLIEGDDIWYTDVVMGGVRKVGSDEILLPDRTMIGGLARNQDGAILVSGLGGIAWMNPQSGRDGNLLEGVNGVNEMRADSSGGIFFGTTDLAAILCGERPGPSTIEHLATDGTLTRCREGLTFANGLCVSPDGTALYFNESFSATRSFPILADKTLDVPDTLVELYDCDGMALDAEGNIWLTGFASDVLRCVTPDGDEVRRLALPGKASTNVRFGGEDMRDLYFTIVDPVAAQALADGVPIAEQNSLICRARSPVPGARPDLAGFKL